MNTGIFRGKNFLTFLEKLFDPFDKQKLDAVVLGCTHYPFVSRELRKVLGEKVALFDGGEGVARETRRRLAEKGLLNEETKNRRFYL